MKLAVALILFSLFSQIALANIPVVLTYQDAYDRMQENDKEFHDVVQTLVQEKDDDIAKKHEEQEALRGEIKSCPDVDCVNDRKTKIRKIDAQIYDREQVYERNRNREREKYVSLAQQILIAGFAGEFLIEIEASDLFELLPSSEPSVYCVKSDIFSNLCRSFVLNLIYKDKIYESKVEIGLRSNENADYEAIRNAIDDREMLMGMVKGVGLEEILTHKFSSQYSLGSHYWYNHKVGYQNLEFVEI